MSNIGHVEGWNKDKPFISDSLEATSFHWAAWTGIEDSTEGSYIQGLIELKNTGKFPILDAKVFLDLDDNGMTWDAYLCNSSGTPIENGSSGAPIGDGFVSYGHPIAPGETVKLKYWWGLKHVAGPTKCDFTVTVNMFPEYRIQVPRSSAHQSETSIQAS